MPSSISSTTESDSDSDTSYAPSESSESSDPDWDPGRGDVGPAEGLSGLRTKSFGRHVPWVPPSVMLETTDVDDPLASSFLTIILPLFFSFPKRLADFCKDIPGLSQAAFADMRDAAFEQLICTTTWVCGNARPITMEVINPCLYLHRILMLRLAAGRLRLQEMASTFRLLVLQYWDGAGRPFGRHKAHVLSVCLPEIMNEPHAQDSWIPMLIHFGTLTAEALNHCTRYMSQLVKLLGTLRIPGIERPVAGYSIALHDLGAAHEVFDDIHPAVAAWFPHKPKTAQPIRALYRCVPCCGSPFITYAHHPNPPPCRLVKSRLKLTMQELMWAYGRHLLVHGVACPLCDVTAILDHLGHKGAASYLTTAFGPSLSYFPRKFTSPHLWKALKKKFRESEDEAADADAQKEASLAVDEEAEAAAAAGKTKKPKRARAQGWREAGSRPPHTIRLNPAKEWLRDTTQGLRCATVSDWKKEGLAPPGTTHHKRVRGRIVIVVRQGKATVAEVLWILRKLAICYGGVDLADFAHRFIEYNRRILDPDDHLDEDWIRTMETMGERIIRDYIAILVERFPYACDTKMSGFEKLSAAEREKIVGARYENHKTCHGPACHAAYRHGVHIYRLVPNRQVAMLCHEEGAEHLFSWIYTFLANMGTPANASTQVECRHIAFVLFFGSLAGNPPITVAGKLLRSHNTAYADKKRSAVK